MFVCAHVVVRRQVGRLSSPRGRCDADRQADAFPHRSGSEDPPRPEMAEWRRHFLSIPDFRRVLGPTHTAQRSLAAQDATVDGTPLPVPSTNATPFCSCCCGGSRVDAVLRHFLSAALCAIRRCGSVVGRTADCILRGRSRLLFPLDPFSCSGGSRLTRSERETVGSCSATGMSFVSRAVGCCN